MRAHILQHTNETPPGLALEWIKQNAHNWTVTQFFENTTLPHEEAIDFLIICGGGMSTNEEQKYPWLKDEKRFIRRCVETGKAVLGLCLGGQLISEALGGTVQRNSEWEVGWHNVQIQNFGSLTAFQYHQDTFSLPQGAELIATNAVCKNQGYRIGERVLGLQFHPEATKEWVQECAEDRDLPKGRFVQTPEEILAGRKNIPAQREWLFKEMDRLTRGLR